MAEDNWADRDQGMRCLSCVFFVPKLDRGGRESLLGRCRRHAPTNTGFPVVFPTDFCGDHRLDENKLGLLTVAPDSHIARRLMDDD